MITEIDVNLLINNLIFNKKKINRCKSQFTIYLLNLSGMSSGISE